MILPATSDTIDWHKKRATYLTFSSESNAVDRVDGVDGDKDRERKSSFSAILLITVFAVTFLSLTLFGINHRSAKLTNQPLFDLKKAAKSVSSSSYPNFVFVIIDDMGYDTIGNDQSEDLVGASPFLNDMMKNGLTLTNYYGQELCTPSRAAFFTGRYPITLGMQYNDVQPSIEWALNEDESILPQILQSFAGYKSYGIGKWHLGHYSSQYLPTSRGFEQYFGYMTAEIFPWSKSFKSSGSYYHDLLYMDAECVAPYSDQNDSLTYSTELFTAKALKVLEYHDFEDPLFLYVSYQAVHSPFDDYASHENGLTAEDVGDTIYAQLGAQIAGSTRLQYALSLYMVDQHIKLIYEKLQSLEQADNTYFVVLSDNGGCYLGGGSNGQLRGAKGTLYEGGVKAQGFIYSPSLLPSSMQQMNYTHLMHVSDWFPTVLSLAGINYIPEDAHALDGVDHSSNFQAMTTDSPREYILYNIYRNISDKTFTPASHTPYAIRDKQYKLMQTFKNNTVSGWYSFVGESFPSDDDLDHGTCTEASSTNGIAVAYLFDLIHDPYEKVNLYDNDDYATERVSRFYSAFSMIIFVIYYYWVLE